MFLISLFVLNFNFVCAEEYYADLVIDVDNSGYVTIDGVTNHPDLLVDNTETYTWKKQSYWLLNITKNENFSDFIYNLNLPRGSSINYIKTSGSIRIEENFGNLLIKGFGQNESLSIIVQYQIKNTSFNVLMLTLIFLVIVLSLYIIVSKLKPKKKDLLDTNKKTDEKIDYNFKGLSGRQIKIMKLLIDSEKPLTQRDIQKELDMPKAAVSRNVHSLELKGLIEIEKIGMSNLIRIKKP